MQIFSPLILFTPLSLSLSHPFTNGLGGVMWVYNSTWVAIVWVVAMVLRWLGFAGCWVFV